MVKQFGLEYVVLKSVPILLYDDFEATLFKWDPMGTSGGSAERVVDKALKGDASMRIFTGNVVDSYGGAKRSFTSKATHKFSFECPVEFAKGVLFLKYFMLSFECCYLDENYAGVKVLPKLILDFETTPPSWQFCNSGGDMELLEDSEMKLNKEGSFARIEIILNLLTKKYETLNVGGTSIPMNKTMFEGDNSAKLISNTVAFYLYTIQDAVQECWIDEVVIKEAI